MPIKFILHGHTNEPQTTNEPSTKCASNCYLDTHDDEDDDYDENSNLTLKSFKLPLPSLSQHMISSFENFRVKMDLNANRSSEHVKCKGEEEEIPENEKEVEKMSMSTYNFTENGNESLMNKENGEKKNDTKNSDSKGNLDTKKASCEMQSAEKLTVSGTNSLDAPEKVVNNNIENNVEDSHIVKSTEIQNRNTDEENPNILNSANSKITEIWLSTEKSFPLLDNLSAVSLTEIDENNNNINDYNHVQIDENNQEHSNEVKSTVTKIIQGKSQDRTTCTAPQFDISTPGTLTPDNCRQNNNNNCNNYNSNNMNYEDEETQITWDQNIPITPTPSGALLNPEDYFYNSSEESDIELMIKIPKMALAQSVLNELSEACSTFTITSIGMPEKKKGESTTEEKSTQNTQENQETISLSIKPVPKPYTNIFSPSKDSSIIQKKVDEEKKEISQLFFNFKGKRDGIILDNKCTDSDSSFPNSPTTRLDDTFMEKNNEHFYCNPDDCYISPPSPSFIIGIQNESRITSKFPNYHQKFSPNKSTVPAKRSASTITDPIKDWDFWKNFVEHHPASADERWNFSRTSFTETQEPESTKASGSNPISDASKTRITPNLSSNSNDVGTSTTTSRNDVSSTLELQPGVENQSVSSSSSSHRTFSEVSSWRKFTLSSGYSEININQLEIQHDVSLGSILTATKGENKILPVGITKSECKVEGGLVKKIEQHQQCTSETSLSSVSEIVQNGNRKPSKLRHKTNTKSNNNNESNKCSTFQLSHLKKEKCPMEGAVLNFDESPIFINEDNNSLQNHDGKYLHSSSSCFSLSDEDGENETAMVRSAVKKGVFPLIIDEKDSEEQEKEDKKLSSSSSRGHFVGDSLEKCPTNIDEKDYEYDKNEKHHPDEKKIKRKTTHSNNDNNNNNPLVVKKHSPTSIKSSQGSLYSVGASLPPKPSVIRSSLSSYQSQSLPRSPRRGRFMKNTEGRGTNKGLITLNKVSSSTLSSKRSESVGSRSSSGFEQGEKMAMMKSKFDYSKIHECDSLHLLRLSRQECQVRNKKVSSPIPSSSSNPVNSSVSSTKHINNYQNIKYDEQKRSRTVPRKLTPKTQ